METGGLDGANGDSRTEMLSRHQKEIKELRDAEIQRKKAAAKGSKAEQKAKKKAIEEDISRLDKEMKERQAKELESLGFVSTAEDSLDGLVRAIAGVTTSEGAVHKPSKGKKWRERRAQQEAEREQRIQDEQQNLVSSRAVEDEELSKKLEPLGYSLREIKPDGHCLYRAIEDQLTLNPVGVQQSFQELRKIAAEYIRSHSDFFLPFIGGTEAELEDHCKEVESTAAWGGQVELEALSHGLEKHIFVYSADMNDVEMGTEYKKPDNPTIRLSYHKHAYGLGEHYNSVVPV